MIASVLAALWVAAPIRVACIGGSGTFGTGTKDPSTQSYPAQLQRFIGANYEVRNFGRSGATLTRAADFPYWGVSEFKAAKDYLPQIVVINLGTNDARPGNWEKAKNVFVPQYKEFISAFQALPSHPKVYICEPTPSFADRQQNTEFAVVPLVAQVAREAKVPAIDLFSIFDNKPDLFPDKLHPNETGYALIAQTVAEAIEDPSARKKSWRVVSVDSFEPGEGDGKNAIDGDPDTYWHTNYSQKETRPPHEIVVDMGKSIQVVGFRHLPRQDGGVNGRVRGFELYLSQDGSSWSEPVLKGDLRNTSAWSTLKLPQAVNARYFKFRALSEWNRGPWTSVAELDVQRAIGP